MPRMFRRDLWRALVRVVRVEHGRLCFAASLAPVVASAEDAIAVLPVMPPGASQSHRVATSVAVGALECSVLEGGHLDHLIGELEEFCLLVVPACLLHAT